MAKSWLARAREFISPPAGAPRRALFPRYTRAYNAAEVSRLTMTFTSSDSSADSELSQALQTMRTRSRQLIRNAPFAKRAREVVVNNVIGTGVGLHAEVMTARAEHHDGINEAIEYAFCEWSRAVNCHTGGALAFADLERAAFAQIFETGECFIRKHHSRFGESEIPLALELIEAERLVDNFGQAGSPAAGNEIRLGIEVDRFFRPVAYWIRSSHPGEISFRQDPQKIERVPAVDMFHLRIVTRWPQTRGEPWLHAVLRKMNDIDGYTEAEILAARSAACYMGFIESSDEMSGNEEKQDDGTFQTELSAGIIDRLKPGEKFNFAAPNRPNSSADTFLRFMLREMAAGVNVSYESLSRDYSQSNYSSSRLALIEDREVWRTFQKWWIRTFRAELHRNFVNAAVLSGAVKIPIAQYAADPAKFYAASFKPRGWAWIDPTKEVEAYSQAVKSGFVTVADVIAQTGGGTNLEDVLEGRERELELMGAAGLEFLTSPSVYVPEATGPAPAPAPASTAPADPTATDDAAAAVADRAARLRKLKGWQSGN